MPDEPTPPPTSSTGPGRRAPRKPAVTIDLPPDQVRSSPSASRPAPEPPRPPTPPPLSPPATPRRFGLAAVILSGLLGGVIVFALGYILIVVDILPGPDRDTATTALDETTRLTATVESLRQQVEANQAPDLSPLGDRVTVLEQLPTELAAMQGQVTALNAAANNTAGQLDAISRELAALREQMTTTAAAGGDPTAANQIMEAIVAVEQRIGALEAAGPPSQLLTLQRRVDTLVQQVNGLGTTVETLATETGDRNRTEAAARSLAMGNLRSAAERGEPFIAETAALAELGVDQAALAPLDPFASATVPTVAALRAQFSDVADAIIAASTAEVEADAGFWARLWGNAVGVVTVRPTGPIEGDTPVAIVSRMEAAVASGDLATALAERQALPAPALDASAAWAEAAQQRIDLDAAVDGLAEALRRAQLAGEAPAAP